MIQNDLDRIFDGILASLGENVLPVVLDPYAKSQVAAAMDLLANIAERVEWRCRDLDEISQQARACFEMAHRIAPHDGVATDAHEAAAALPHPEIAENSVLLASYRQNMKSLGNIHKWTAEQPDQSSNEMVRLRGLVDGLVRQTQTVEFQRMRSARERMRRITSGPSTMNDAREPQPPESEEMTHLVNSD